MALTAWQAAVKAAGGDMKKAKASYCKQPHAKRARKNTTGKSRCRGGPAKKSKKAKKATKAKGAAKKRALKTMPRINFVASEELARALVANDLAKLDKELAKRDPNKPITASQMAQIERML